MSLTPEQLMRRAIELSGCGYPAPNPHVGCVIAQNGEIVGEGFHDHAGAAHAEVVALQQAGARARAADVYVTLEPCNHHGRTPPCSNALIQAGVASVTAAEKDPNPKAAGGLQALQASGIKVSSGLLQAGAREANLSWLTAMERGWPYVVGKVAMGLDGRVALPSGESKWITSEAARAAGQMLRAESGAVLVGRNTVQRDDPMLTVRREGIVNQPTRIVLDPNAALTGREHIFGDEAPTLHVVRHPIRENDMDAPMVGDKVDLLALLKSLFDRGLTGLLVEGGPITIGRFLEAGLIDRLEIFMAPKALGNGPAWLNANVPSLVDAFDFRLSRLERLEDDLQLTYFPVRRPLETAGP